MAVSAGTRLGPYEMLAPLGVGAMGEVWKVRDTRLDRTVAIKVSAAGFSEPLQRQARSVAALNHPHICRLSDELLALDVLHHQIVLALQYAIQVAEALEAAHEKSIIHGNLKPVEFVVTKSGVKVVDFGLAKIRVPAEAAAAGGAQTLGIAMENTNPGAIQYMAPEQLEAKECEARSDIFANLTSAIMSREPPSVSGRAPATLDHIIRRCLTKIRTTVGRRQGIWCWRCA